MKRRTWILAVLLSVCMLFGGTVTTEAAKTSAKTAAYQAVFDADYYYNTYPDLQTAIGYDAQKLFEHFVTNGIKEGRSGCADFNVQVYKTNYPDLQAAFGNDLASYCTHYVTYGVKEGRNATSLIAAAGTTQNSVVKATCTTTFDPKASRANNIAVSAARINGVVLKPGETFSFSKTILPRTAENGYVEAPIYISGKHGVGIGGGICQVSSTLYSALLDAGIPATERYPHSLPVAYVPAGRDATISGTAKDLKFVNTLNTPLQISAAVDMENGTVTVTLIQQL